jgi:hypothetical protein
MTRIALNAGPRELSPSARHLTTEILMADLDDDLIFWMVWNPAGRNPTEQHLSQSLATAEAERLARINPGEKFYVLRATHLRQVNDMRRVDLVDYPIPF